jgi:hypothetical protein
MIHGHPTTVTRRGGRHKDEQFSPELFWQSRLSARKDARNRAPVPRPPRQGTALHLVTFRLCSSRVPPSCCGRCLRDSVEAENHRLKPVPLQAVKTTPD